MADGPCNGACGNGPGLLPEVYVVTVTSAYGGYDCPEVNGTARLVTDCNNTTPCPVDCVGDWMVPDATNCTGHCSRGDGFVQELYFVNQTDMYGGHPCPYANETIR